MPTNWRLEKVLPAKLRVHLAREDRRAAHEEARDERAQHRVHADEIGYQREGRGHDGLSLLGGHSLGYKDGLECRQNRLPATVAASG